MHTPRDRRDISEAARSPLPACAIAAIGSSAGSRTSTSTCTRVSAPPCRVSSAETCPASGVGDDLLHNDPPFAGAECSARPAVVSAPHDPPATPMMYGVRRKGDKWRCNAAMSSSISARSPVAVRLPLRTVRGQLGRLTATRQSADAETDAYRWQAERLLDAIPSEVITAAGLLPQPVDSQRWILLEVLSRTRAWPAIGTTCRTQLVIRTGEDVPI